MGLRLIASDIDGTILPRSGIISERVIRAFRAARDAGIEVVFVTGRGPRAISLLADQVGHLGSVICANGSLVYDMATETVVSARTIPAGIAREVGGLLRDQLPGVTFAVEAIDDFRAEIAYLEQSVPSAFTAYVTVRGGGFEDLLTGEPQIVKILVRASTGTSDDLLAAAEPLIGSHVTLTHSNPHGSLIELSLSGINKAVGLEAFSAERGISAGDVVAFGDMPNDVEMLAWAGRGYAMADGHPRAVAAADAVAPSLEEDGVAQVLERLLAENT